MVARLGPEDPARIGRYRLLGLLGTGGMGRVLLATGPDGRFVAIKQIHPHLVAEEGFLSRFRREAEISARVSGAFTAAVVDFEVDSDSPWLASVFVPGVSLDRAVADFGPLSEDRILSLAVGLAAALRAVHRVGLVHRDLKPANVILAEDGPRVIDFGIARAVGDGSDLTGTGSIIGSPAFMSPEQALSESLTPASDIFSLAVVLIMAATGRSPFAGSTMPDTLYKILHGEPDLRALPPRVRELVVPCLRKDPGSRPTVEEILDFLGPMPQGPPWSSDVHRAIRRHTDEAAALADPEATRIDDGTGIPPQVVRTSSGDRMAGPPHAGHGGRRRWAAVTAAVTVLIVAVAVGVIWGQGRHVEPTETANPLGDMNLTTLRSLDMCALIEEPSAMGNASRPPSSSRWGSCDAQAGEYRLEVAVDRIDGFHTTGRTAAGVPILILDAPETDSCTRGLQPARTDPQYGVTVRVLGGSGQDRCARADSAVVHLAARITAGPPLLPDIRYSLARQDPCSLVTNDAINMKVGDRVPGSAEALHACTWIGANTLTIDLGREQPPDPVTRPIRLDGLPPGEDVFVTEAELDSPTCTRTGIYRILGDGSAEIVTARAENRSVLRTPGIRCAIAQEIVQNILANLPGGR
ncbi:serine/threonine-protein kinase [Nocardia sp. alder85J]|uniref:serine/threonine-protein kinase n=1 Tax=Nocardia sp. alder85J TaxID=2862949 RepID=UPI001CD4D73C|nr:serine/threonine-protein kinase [Nocardia sp. alder85J]MCX4097847.1 serine/threonine-protein kinase [Nocardia sp. alder85J]